MSPKLPTRALGKDGPQITGLGLGCMGLSAFYGTPKSDETRFKLLDRALEIGATFWDSADVYQDNEDLIGKWFKRTGARDQIFLATKFAATFENGQMGVRSDPEYVLQACEKSLKRLGVNKIDLYYMHRTDQVTPIEKTVEAMAQLKKEGKIDYLGLSEVSSETLRRACKVHHIAAVQIEYSPFDVDIEKDSIGLLKTCRELGVAVVCYSPLGRGMLTGRYKSIDDLEENDARRGLPRFSPENFSKNLDLVAKFEEIAKKKGCTASQLTLAWLLAQGPEIIPIPGTTRTEALEENIGALHIVIDSAEEAEIRRLVDAAEVHGARYASRVNPSSLFADTPPL